MRRDVCYVFPVCVDVLYNAYLQAATNDRFRREPDQKPYYCMSFGLNFSMKYNMNGGACTLRFMPCQNGSAVNLRFSIAQGFGARYEKYAQDLTDTAAQIIGMPGMLAQIDVEEFMKPANMVSVVAPVQPAPVSAPVPETNGKICAACGGKLKQEDRFCIFCGKPAQEPASRFCDKCGSQVRPEAVFCSACGNKL